MMDEKDMERLRGLPEKEQLEFLWEMVFGLEKVLDAYGMIWALWEKKMHEFQMESVQEMQKFSRRKHEENPDQRM